MPKLSWIDDTVLESIVSELLKKAYASKKFSFGRNVIDPFSAVFEIAGFELDYEEWVKSETTRQAQKTLQNHIGQFHQDILGSCKGWVNQKTGNIIDLICEEKNIIAEIKNKYNTISGGKLANLYTDLENMVNPKNSKYKDFTAYYVVIVPKSPLRYNKEFTPSDKGSGKRCQNNDKIREIDGASFYEIVTGDKNALENMFDALPEIIEKISNFSFKDKSKIKDFFRLAYQ